MAKQTCKTTLEKKISSSSPHEGLTERVHQVSSGFKAAIHWQISQENRCQLSGSPSVPEEILKGGASTKKKKEIERRKMR